MNSSGNAFVGSHPIISGKDVVLYQLSRAVKAHSRTTQAVKMKDYVAKYKTREALF